MIRLSRWAGRSSVTLCAGAKNVHTVYSIQYNACNCNCTARLEGHTGGGVCFPFLQVFDGVLITGL
jgi:hypothetical protein